MPFRNTLTIVVVTLMSLVCYQKATHNRYASTVSHAMEIIENNYVEEVAPRVVRACDARHGARA